MASLFLTEPEVFARQMCYMLDHTPSKPAAAPPSPSPPKSPSSPASTSLSQPDIQPDSPMMPTIKYEEGDDDKPLFFEDLPEFTLPPPPYTQVAGVDVPTVLQAHSPLIQYEYVAVDSEGREPNDSSFVDETGVTHIGLAYMPSSVPPALGAEEVDGDPDLDHLAPHDWRRLLSVDLDDIVATYGVQASSIRLSDRESLISREPFRYGEKNQTATVENLPENLQRELERLSTAGRIWYERTTQIHAASQPAEKLQTQLPLSPDKLRNESILGPRALTDEKEEKWSPTMPLHKQLITRKAPTMRLYLSGLQRDMELRMIHQHRIQVAFLKDKWIGSDGEKELKRLEERHGLHLNTGRHQPPRPLLTQTSLVSHIGPNDTPGKKSHSKNRSPAPQRLVRRILVVWDVAAERCALDRLAPSFLKQFDGWVDLQQVATPVLRVACGHFLGYNDATMSLRDAMLAASFRQGYSLQEAKDENGPSHDPGMDAVRTLGMLARLVAYPASDMSRMEQEARAARFAKDNTEVNRPSNCTLEESMHPCFVDLSVRQRPGKEYGPANLQHSAYSQVPVPVPEPKQDLYAPDPESNVPDMTGEEIRRQIAEFKQRRATIGGCPGQWKRKRWVPGFIQARRAERNQKYQEKHRAHDLGAPEAA
ncbi:hypothetical protein SEUCBS139899_003823 [Sporothrix eucalyptigena]